MGFAVQEVVCAPGPPRDSVSIMVTPWRSRRSYSSRCILAALCHHQHNAVCLQLLPACSQ